MCLVKFMKKKMKLQAEIAKFWTHISINTIVLHHLQLQVTDSLRELFHCLTTISDLNMPKEVRQIQL